MNSIPHDSTLPLDDKQRNQINSTLVHIGGVPYVQISIASPTLPVGAMILLSPAEAEAHAAHVLAHLTDPAVSHFLASVEETPPC